MIFSLISCLYSLATRDTIDMTQKMAAAGADAVMVVTPSYYKGGMKVMTHSWTL